jgi:DNA-binding MarR family transcriptional regulator
MEAATRDGLPSLAGKTPRLDKLCPQVYLELYIQVKLTLSSLLSTTLPQLDLRGTGYCASLNFRRTARAVTRLYDSLAFQGTGIRSTQFTILIGVAKTQPTSMSALGAMLVIDSTTLTRSLAKLQKLGLLTISRRGARRQRFVSLTPKGEKSLADSLPGWRIAQERFVKAVGADFWLGFRSELERLAHLAVTLETPGGEAAQVTPSPQGEL